MNVHVKSHIQLKYKSLAHNIRNVTDQLIQQLHVHIFLH